MKTSKKMLLGPKLIKETKKFPYEMFKEKKKNKTTNQTKQGTPPPNFACSGIQLLGTVENVVMKCLTKTPRSKLHRKGRGGSFANPL